MPSMDDEDKLNELNCFLNILQEHAIPNIMKMYFVQKNSNSTYISFMPQISSDLQRKILDVILPNLKKSLQHQKMVDYNPIGVADGENEKLVSNQVNSITDFLESINEEKVYTDMTNLKIDRISFYVIQISWDSNVVYLFRQFSKVSRLRKGLLSQIVENELKEMDNKFLGIDEFTDMILFKNDLLILNHISLERIFNYRDEFLNMTTTALNEIGNQNIIQNMDQFSEDCKRDIRIMKRFANMTDSNRLPLFFQHYEKVPRIVQTLGLDLEFDENGQIIYREKSQLFHIINLMSDAYFRSLLADRIGIAKTEDKL